MKRIICCIIVCVSSIVYAQQSVITITISGYTPQLGCNPISSQVSGAFGTASATSNNCPGAVTITSVTDGPVVSNGCNHSQTRTWTVRDRCKNTASTSRTVSWKVDITPPFILSPPDRQLACNPNESAINSALGNAVATDACGAVTVIVTDNAVVSNGCARSKKRNWLFTDGCGNTSTASATVSWNEDLIAPVISVSGHVPNLGCNPSGASIEQGLGQATVTDNCGTPTVNVSGGGITNNGCNRSKTKTWTATDNCGNVTTVSRTVTWTVDLSNPSIIAPPNSTLGCNPSAAAINAAFGNAAAADNCGVGTITFTDGPVISSGCNRYQQRKWTASDGCGNISTASNTVSWAENILTINITGDNPNRGCNPTIPVELGFGTATASGTCNTPVLTVTDGPVISNGCNRSKTRTWSATGSCDNSTNNVTATVSRTVNWIVDFIPPVFTGNYSTVNLGVAPSQLQINQALNGATATDGCGTATITSGDSDVPTNDPCLFSRVRIFTARDGCGNQTTISRTVTWIPCVANPLINVMDVTVSETAGFARVNVFLSAPGSSTVTVRYRTSNGTARTPGDYTSTSGTLSFPSGTGIRFFDVPIINDNVTEGDESFFIALSNPQNGTINDGNGTVTITESQLLTRSRNANEFQSEDQRSAFMVPNPQRRTETLKFHGRAPGSFDVSIIDMQGRVITKLKNYRNTWKLSSLSPGIYFYHLEYRSEKEPVIKRGRLLITD